MYVGLYELLFTLFYVLGLFAFVTYSLLDTGIVKYWNIADVGAPKSENYGLIIR